MSTKVALIIGGPALVQYRGATVYSKNDIVLDPTIEAFAVVVDRYQEVDQRVLNQPLKIRFTPAGEWEALGVLYPYAGMALGELITPVRTFGTVTTGTDNVQILGHGLITGDVIRASSSGTLPAGLSSATAYYIRAVDADNIKFYDTYAHAVAGGGTGLIDITDVGTGTHKLVVNNPLTITSFSGKQYTFFNAAVTKMPDINVSAVNTLLEEIEFEAFLQEGANWGDANSLFSLADVAVPVDTTFDPANILTQPATIAWGATPWDSLPTKSGVKISFALELTAVETDTDGVLTRRLSGITVGATAQPLGINEADLMAKLLLQGSGAKRGRSLSGSDLNISATSFYVRLYGAALMGGPQSFGTKTDRIGNLSWKATRTFVSGVPNPLFFVGASAPS